MNIPEIEQAQAEIIEQFDGLDEWLDRYAVIIDMGNDLEPLPDGLKTPSRRIEGCQSNVWIDSTLNADGTLTFRADSDALIVKGIIAMLVKVLSGRRPADILDADLHFIRDLGIDTHLSPTRSNGLLAMLKSIKATAAAYAASSRTP